MTHEAIERFITRVRQAARTNARVVNVTMDEAQDVINDLALLVLRENELLAEIQRLQREQGPREITLGGRGFKD